MRVLTFSLLLLQPFLSFGQTSYAGIDQYVKGLEIKTKNTWKIAQQIITPYQSDDERVRAIYVWVTHNIDYDCRLYEDKAKQRKLAQKKLKKRLNHTLKKHSAICGGYAELFQILCRAAGLECEIVIGYSKSENKHIGVYKRADHAWNAVKINGDWKLIDATWGSGYVDEGKFYRAFTDSYFLADPDKFILNHLPTKDRWRLTDREVDRTDFYNFPLFHNDYFNNSLELMPESLNGVIEVETDETFQIEFKSPREDHFLHVQRNEKEKEAEPIIFQKKEDNVYSIDLCFQEKGRHFITIAVDLKPMWTYCVIVK